MSIEQTYICVHCRYPSTDFERPCVNGRVHALHASTQTPEVLILSLHSLEGCHVGDKTETYDSQCIVEPSVEHVYREYERLVKIHGESITIKGLLQNLRIDYKNLKIP